VGLLFVLAQSKHQNSLFRYRSKTTEKTVLKQTKKIEKTEKTEKTEKNQQKTKKNKKKKKP
jgi:hypothetical protein